MNVLEDVKQFHLLFNHPVLTTPTIPSEDRCNLRVSLLQEELNELKDGIANKDIVEIADALADIQYVLAGAIHEFGLANLFPSIFGEVQRSNMSKACRYKIDALNTIKKYKNEGVDSHWVFKHITEKNSEDTIGIYIVVRDGDLKTLKSINYSPADLSFIKDYKNESI